MLVLAVASHAVARRWSARAVALMLGAGFLLGAGACSRRAEAPVVVDAALERPLPPAAPVVKDAAVDLIVPVDAQPDADKALAGQARGRAHRAVPPPRPAAGVFKVSGSITKADAETVLRGARGKLNACYDKERAKNAALAGRVIFRLSIDDRGRVPLTEVITSTLGGGDPELCMVEALRDLKFPPSSTGGESTLTFPMVFGR
jgi:hypothetical protein